MWTAYLPDGTIIGIDVGNEMPYNNMTIMDLFHPLLSYWLLKSPSVGPAIAWVEAENIMTVRLKVGEWFNALEAGTANDNYPDPLANWLTPDGREITQERADEFVEVMETDFLVEKGRWTGLGKNEGPGITRLEPHARIAFMLDIWSVMKSNEQLVLEAQQKLQAGEYIPPHDPVNKKPEEEAPSIDEHEAQDG